MTSEAISVSTTKPPVGSLRKETILPGFGLTLGLTVLYLSLIVLLPLAALVFASSQMGLQGFVDAAFTPRALAAYRLSFGTSFVAAAIVSVIGLVIAWGLVRYSFPGKRLLDAVVDLPFALPTAVAGIALASIYAENGWVGAPLAALGLKVAFTPVGIVVALLFQGLPFVVRTVEPVLQDLDKEVEEAAASLGAGRIQTFAKVILPAILPAILTGFALAFARGLGEYGSVIFIAGNLPMVSEIAPLLIIIKLEQFDYAGATAIATVMLVAGFAMLFVINWLQRWNKRRGS